MQFEPGMENVKGSFFKAVLQHIKHPSILASKTVILSKICGKIKKKSNKPEQDQKTLITAFA